MVPAAALDVRGVARGGVVGFFQRQQRFGRVFLQIQAGVEQAVRQRAVLLVDKADGAFAVPVGGVVAFRRQAGVARLPERHDDDERRQYAPQHQRGHAVAQVAGQPAPPPQPAARAQRIPGQQRQQDTAEAQRRKRQRARRVGRDAGDGERHRVLRMRGAVPAGLQHQAVYIAGQVQADDLAARRLRAHLPGAETDQRAVGVVGALDVKGEGAVGVQRVGIVVGQVVELQVVDGPVDVKKAQVGAALLQRPGAVAALDVDVGVKVVHQLEGLVAVGVEVGYIAHKQLRPRRHGQQQRQHEPQPAPPERAQARRAETGPAAQRRDGQQPEPVKPDGKPRPVVGAQAEQPYPGPQPRRPGGIPPGRRPPGQPGRGHAGCKRQKRRQRQRRNDHGSPLPLRFACAKIQFVFLYRHITTCYFPFAAQGVPPSAAGCRPTRQSSAVRHASAQPVIISSLWV